MAFNLIGPSLYVDERGRLLSEQNGKIDLVRTKETEAEDRYVERHLRKEGGTRNEKN